MKLQDTLFSITSQSVQDGQPAFLVKINKAWPIYKAHFPGHPITPGVCIVQMVQELLQVATGRNVGLVSAKNIKYVAIISPEEVDELSIVYPKIEPQDDGSLKVQAQVLSGETLFTKISATFR